MPVGLVMAIAPNDAISHGAISKVAKLRLASTILPLLIVGVVRPPGVGGAGDAVLGCMRDMLIGVGVVVFDLVLDDDGEETRCFFRDFAKSSSADELFVEHDT